MTIQTLSDQVRIWRAAHRITQRQLADLLGINPATIHNWENGNTRVPGYIMLALEKLAETLHVKNQ